MDKVRSGMTPKQIIAGALYAFAAKLTCLPKPITAGQNEHAGPMAEAVDAFCREAFGDKYGEPAVANWRELAALLPVVNADIDPDFAAKMERASVMRMEFTVEEAKTIFVRAMVRDMMRPLRLGPLRMEGGKAVADVRGMEQAASIGTSALNALSCELASIDPQDVKRAAHAGVFLSDVPAGGMNRDAMKTGGIRISLDTSMPPDAARFSDGAQAYARRVVRDTTCRVHGKGGCNCAPGKCRDDGQA